METKTMLDECRQKFHVVTEITQLEVINARDERDFYVQIYRNIATSLADKVMEKLAPAIDKALKELKMGK